MVVAAGSRPIGMFDAGLGGLTVARAVIDLLPHEDLIYFGDTARCPYGPLEPEVIRRYSLEIADHLVERGVKLLVVACNSAESAAFYESTGRYDVPIVTVIEPGVRAAVAATRNRRIGMIGTEATVDSEAYESAMAKTRANVEFFVQACPKFVEFVESGDTTSDALIAAAEEYLLPLKEKAIDTLILGCTHYPLLSGVIQYVMGEEVVLVSSAEPTANEVYADLLDADLLNRQEQPGDLKFVLSGDPDPELGRRFLGPEFGNVENHPWGKA
ncbi:MAG TPA: glutamate racemase [Actinomycetota bacterium]|nr:glutamate racemase [Actinomycetota bacterium]